MAHWIHTYMYTLLTYQRWEGLWLADVVSQCCVARLGQSWHSCRSVVKVCQHITFLASRRHPPEHVSSCSLAMFMGTSYRERAALLSVLELCILSLSSCLLHGGVCLLPPTGQIYTGNYPQRDISQCEDLEQFFCFTSSLHSLPVVVSGYVSQSLMSVAS